MRGRGAGIPDDIPDLWFELLRAAVMVGEQLCGVRVEERVLSWNMLRLRGLGNMVGVPLVYWAPAPFQALCLTLEHVSHLL